METHRVVILPVWIGGSTGYVYDVYMKDELIVSRSKVPSCDAARYLQGQGLGGMLEVYRWGKDSPDMTGKIGVLAIKTVAESAKGPLRFMKWSPFNKPGEGDDVTS